MPCEFLVSLFKCKHLCVATLKQEKLWICKAELVSISHIDGIIHSLIKQALTEVLLCVRPWSMSLIKQTKNRAGIHSMETDIKQDTNLKICIHILTLYMYMHVYDMYTCNTHTLIYID